MGLNWGDESAGVGLQKSESDQQRIVMRDLQWEDINYANSFPANICTNSCVVVQIPEQGQGVVLYTCKVRGTQAKCYLPLEFAERYTNDIYVFGA
jgi:hypothetical protein